MTNDWTAGAVRYSENDMQKDKLFAKSNEKKLTHLTRRLGAMGHEVQHLSYRLRQP